MGRSYEGTGQLCDRINPTPMTTFRPDGVERDELRIPERRIGRSVTRDDSQRLTVTGVSAGQRCVTVALHGELDTTTALILFGQLAFFCVGNPWMMVADMTGVTLIDAAGVTALIDARLALRLRSCHLTVTEPSVTVRRILELGGFSNWSNDDGDDTANG